MLTFLLVDPELRYSPEVSGRGRRREGQVTLVGASYILILSCTLIASIQCIC